MGIIVQKFGGTSVADTEKLFKVCKHITKEFDKGNQVVVVVSAQGKTTDKLISEEREITNIPDKREHDVLVATGEQITIAKLAMCLKKLNYNAVSYMGWQVPIITDSVHGNARIKSIDNTKILKDLNNNNIVIIAGFQGIDKNGNITTLGRGGSDTTAVALAAILKADRCDIFTDVDGVFSSDPRKVENTIKIESITYDEMLELASSGAKVLHNRCVEIGKNFNIPIIVKSTFEDNSEGTIVKYRKDLEDLYISGIAKQDDIVRITLNGLENNIEKVYQLFNLLAKSDISIDMITKSLDCKNLRDLSFSISSENLNKTMNVLNENKKILGIKNINCSENLSKVSLIGVGIANIPTVATKVIEALYENNINMHMISTSEIKISILVDKNKSDIAMNAIHKKFIN